MSLLWAPIVLCAAAAQTARNAAQSRLTEAIGTFGATQVRFVYGLPFAAVFLPALLWITGEAMPAMPRAAAGFVVVGAIAQVAATALMLDAMRRGGFAVTTALMKTEPLQVAAFGLVFLGDPLTPLRLAAIVLAMAGVVLVSKLSGRALAAQAGWRPAVMGVAAGACFGIAAVGFRGGILALESGSFVIRASTVLLWSLAIQTSVVGVFLMVVDRRALLGSLTVWRTSLFAGFLGASASQFWFLGFALTTAANVRTLALVEVLMARAVSGRMFAETFSLRQWAGTAMILGGVALLVWGAREG
jgi:drug/metabolite transporter (DMT)-like permease